MIVQSVVKIKTSLFYLQDILTAHVDFLIILD